MGGGASGFVAVCGAIGAGIAAANAITNAVTSFKAANAACNGDPTWARRYSKQDTLSQVIRETNFNNKYLNDLSYKGAKLIDNTEQICAFVGLAQLGLSLKNVFSRNLKISFKPGNFKASIKESYSSLKIKSKRGFTNLKASIKNEFKNIRGSIKNIFGKADNLDDISALNIIDDINPHATGGTSISLMDDVNVNVVDDVFTEGGSEAVPKPYTNSRPSYRNGVVDQVWENAKGPDGFVRDPNTGDIIHFI